ncbi:methyltransferase domain-containing protein [Streptomyces vilmorinianum]|uniref:methyltransferase domain-containing protein n=1 Tax=Streptomyces vilmorinianum TaxID=3051092 RepID=UPI0010FBA983|nr:methyltransferase domain-containing protein [Streptomyces vilmorinianum]
MTTEATTADTAAARGKLVQTLIDAGAITDPRWRAAFEDVPRHLFVPFYFDHSGVRIAGDDPATIEQWFAAVHSDKSLVTHRTEGAATSSSTEPSLMAAMLHALEVDDGMHVLEIGTGTGYNAALLSHRLGDGQVVTVDIALDITGPARERLTAAGYAPHVVTGDGAEGWPPDAPYDRIIATCRLDAIPRTLIHQLTDSGVILAPLGNALARITRTGPETAEGQFLSGAFFMAMRHGRGTGVTRRPDLPAGSGRPSLLPLADIVDGTFRFLVSIVAPGLVWQYDLDDTGTPDGTRVWSPDGSIASVTADGTVRETGSLWARLEAAHEVFVAHDRPAADRYGVTIDQEEQRVWLDSPAGPSWTIHES